MNKCPYCQNEMKKGFIKGDGRDDLTWVDENRKRNTMQKIANVFYSNNDDCIVLEGASFIHKTRVLSNYCDICEKIIIDIR